MNTSFFGELIQTISERSRALVERKRGQTPDPAREFEHLLSDCDALLSTRGESSGVALAGDVLARYATLTLDARIAFFEALAGRYGFDHSRLLTAVTEWQADASLEATSKLQQAAEPRRQELLRRLNLAPGGTRALVRMRENLLDVLQDRADLKAVDSDFIHLFVSWFNRGFLVLRRIDWSTPAVILEKLIHYEAVHAIRGFEDLRRRIDPPDRRCYAFFHPALVDEPLIFVEVALTRGIPNAIAPILTDAREVLDPTKADTAVFYSISNCQRGLSGVSFGSFLIKQVVEEVSRNLGNLSTFVTLSPAPNFAKWLSVECLRQDSKFMKSRDSEVLLALENGGWHHRQHDVEKLREPVLQAAARYFLQTKSQRGFPIDSVARFHLGNGARLEQINWMADLSEKGLKQSFGVMVNYRYDLDSIEKNHENYVAGGPIAVASKVLRAYPPNVS